MRRWKSLKPIVIDETGVVCNIQEFHTNYYDAFCYVKKEGADYFNYIKREPSTDKFSIDKESSAKQVLNTSPDDLRVPPTPVKKAKDRRRDTLKVYVIIVDNRPETERE